MAPNILGIVARPILWVRLREERHHTAGGTQDLVACWFDSSNAHRVTEGHARGNP